MTEQEAVARRNCAAGEIIFEDGAPGSAAFVVERGKVEISKTAPAGGQSQVLGFIGVGGIFGEMALIDNRPRMARARALEPTTLIVITEATLRQKLSRSDPFVRGLLNMFVRNIRSLTEQLVATGQAAE